jgi:methionyl-tRNA synthetase
MPRGLARPRVAALPLPHVRQDRIRTVVFSCAPDARRALHAELDMSKPFYITTPIYYPNAEPHIGHCYTTIAADTIARYHRLVGEDTYFLTGTDEHGIKMVKTASDQKTEPGVLADRVVGVFQQVWKELDITYDDFIRTTQARHKLAVQEIVRRLEAKGDIYLGSYEGWYDEGQEEFVTETEAKANEYKSAVTRKPLTRYKEPTYFFRLTKYVPEILAYIESHSEFIQPDSRRNEVLSKLRAGVSDLSISRATLKWGIPMPHDPSHVLYVWIDALSNYVTALGFPSADEAKFKRYWPADLHLIGKEILWFHAVYWPAMLMSLGVALPKRLFAHGWWTANGMKMGKSTGNFIGLEKIRAIGAAYGYDALRYYLLRAAPFGGDLDWTDADFNKSYTELGNVLGNLLNRVLKMVNKYRDGRVPEPGAAREALDVELENAIGDFVPRLHGAYAACELQQCAVLPIELARLGNKYVDTTEPFKLAKNPADAGRLDTVLYLSARTIYTALVGLLPVLPEKAAAGLGQLGAAVKGRTMEDLFAKRVGPGQKVGAGEPLFPRVEGKTER